MDEPGPIYLVQREVIEAVGECHDERIGPSADDDLFLRLVARYTLYYSGNPYHAHNPTRHWSIVDQAIEDLKTLRKVFKDDALPLN